MNTKDAEAGGGVAVAGDDDGGGIGWRPETSAETVIDGVLDVEDPLLLFPPPVVVVVEEAPEVDDWLGNWMGLRVAMVIPPWGVSLRHCRVLRTGK